MNDFRASRDIRTEANIREMADLALLTDVKEFADAEIAWNVTHGAMSIRDDDIAMDASLETAVIISLFTDARAGDDDELPAGEKNPRGWWGDDLNDIPGDITGSKLWLLCREKQQTRVVKRAEEYARVALAWLVEDGLASKVVVEGSIPRAGWLGLSITIHRPSRKEANYKYHYNWQEQEYRRAS